MLLRHCLTCLLQRSDYRELEIVLIDGGELSREELAEFETMTAYGLGPGRWRHARSDLALQLQPADQPGGCCSAG